MYKNKYIIALYNKHDECITVSESVREVAEYLNQPLPKMKVIVSRALHRENYHTYIIVNSRLINIYLIES